MIRPDFKTYHVVSALVMTPADDILLIRQLLPDRAESALEHGQDADFFWTFPGGKMEPGETHEQALIREVQEETGLVIAEPFEAVGRCQYGNPAEKWVCDIHLYKATDYSGTIHIDDPCHRVAEARFFPRDEALAKIALIPWLCMREPLTQYLNNKRIADWYYHFKTDGICESLTADQFISLVK